VKTQGFRLFGGATTNTVTGMCPDAARLPALNGEAFADPACRALDALRWDYPPYADYTLPVAPVPIRGLFSRATTRTAGRESGAMGNPRLAARISWTVTEVATRT
jgi:hypothetical protein